MRKVAPGFQQMSGSKEAAASLRRGHIQRLNLRYTQVSRQELRCLPYPARLTQRTGHAGSGLREERWRASGRPGLVCELGPLGPEVPCAQAEIGPMVHIRLSNPSQGMAGVGWSDCLSGSSHQDHRLQGTPFERRGSLCRQKRVNGRFSSVFQTSSLTIRNLFKLHPRL